MCHVGSIIMNTTETPVQHHSSRTLCIPPPLSQVCIAKERVTRHYSHRQYGPHKFALSQRVTHFISYMKEQSIPVLTTSDKNHLRLGPMTVCEHKFPTIPILIYCHLPYTATNCGDVSGFDCMSHMEFCHKRF